MEMKVEDLLAKLRQELKSELLEDILPYWLENTMDLRHGGIIGRIDFENNADSSADKGAILTARVVWTFSAAYRRFQNPRYKKMARHAFQYLTETMWDEEYGGVFWMVSAQGKPTDSRKHVYAQAFAMYALSEYYLAFDDEKALRLAKELYQLVESNCRDTQHGGYYESYTYNWQLMDDVRLSEKDINEPKSMNTHLHVLEAYTNLYRCWQNDELAHKLSDLIDLFADHIVNTERTSMHTFLGEEWDVRSDEISFGHDIEASWLLIEAAEVLQDYPRRKELEQISLSLAEAVLQNGLDADGGLFNEAGSEGLTDDNKDWWPQAEALVGFVNAWQLSGHNKFLAAALQVWEFIKAHMLDTEHGEWHEKVDRTGVAHKLDKVRSWKCPYHNGRAVLEILIRSKHILAELPENALQKTVALAERPAKES